MFRCQATGEVVDKKIQPLMVVVERYGPTDFVTRKVVTVDERTGKKEEKEINISLDGQIKKELKIAPWNLSKVKVCEHKKAPQTLKSKSYDNVDLFDEEWMDTYQTYKNSQNRAAESARYKELQSAGLPTVYINFKLEQEFHR